jgi:hypothetical protein
MPVKVVINSHHSYHHCLQVMMQSLCFLDHTDDIILCISDVPAEDADAVRARYAEAYQLPDESVLTTSSNIDEYSAFVALGAAMNQESCPWGKDTLFLMLHDTCEAGRLFWGKLAELELMIQQISKPPPPLVIDKGTNGFTVYRIPDWMEPAKMLVQREHSNDQLCVYFNQFVYDRVQKRLKTICSVPDGPATKTIVGFLDRNFNVCLTEPEGMPFESEETINDTITQHCRKYLWYPVSGNFNLGIATGAFIVDHLFPAYKSVSTLSKTEGIDIEVNENNPLNIRKLASIDGMSAWRYIHALDHSPTTCRYPTMSLWVNDTDAYGTGKRRNVSFLHTLDLKKYSCLVGKLWNTTHDVR